MGFVDGLLIRMVVGVGGLSLLVNVFGCRRMRMGLWACIIPLPGPDRGAIPWTGVRVKGRGALACDAVGALDAGVRERMIGRWGPGRFGEGPVDPAGVVDCLWAGSGSGHAADGLAAG